MGSLNLWQIGHPGMRFAITTPDFICIVAIDVGLCRSGRIGGAVGSLTLQLPKTLDLRSVSSAA
jgi:hypothetical protein